MKLAARVYRRGQVYMRVDARIISSNMWPKQEGIVIQHTILAGPANHS